MEAIAGGILYCVPSCIPMTFLRTMMSDFNNDHATSNATLMLTHKGHTDFKPPPIVGSEAGRIEFLLKFSWRGVRGHKERSMAA